jgi:hypothetical protein
VCAYIPILAIRDARSCTTAFNIYLEKMSHEILIATINSALAAELTTEDGRCVGMPVSLTVEGIFQPCTMSVVAVVAISGQEQLPPLMALKLFDRRFAHSLRDQHQAGMWTPGKEQELWAFNSQENRPRISVDPDNDSCDEENTAEWSEGHREAYLEEVCKDFYVTELGAYRRLASLQGTLLPKLYGTVRCDLLGGTVNGLLLEYLGEKAFTLEDLPWTVGEEELQVIYDASLTAVGNIGDQGVIHCDINLGNVMVVPAKVPRVVIIDFGLARLRRVGESDEHWSKCRRFWDMEGPWRTQEPDEPGEDLSAYA